ncbi:MAG: ribosomal protein S18-alanine N-acetyltransferase [Fibrobacter sp.]|nr:ribosomal protein S18-alanine N-acetyltransferase [Fibrobacter sp.]
MPIRKMELKDIPAVLDIQNALSFQDWNERQMKQEISANYTYAVVYENSFSEILGYAIFHLLGPDTELLSIAVGEKAQRSGIGSELLLSGFAQLNFEDGDCCFLEVRENNQKARQFYEKYGFQLFGIRKKYYSDGENAALYKVESASLGEVFKGV